MFVRVGRGDPGADGPELRVDQHESAATRQEAIHGEVRRFTTLLTTVNVHVGILARQREFQQLLANDMSEDDETAGDLMVRQRRPGTGVPFRRGFRRSAGTDVRDREDGGVPCEPSRRHEPRRRIQQRLMR